MHQLRNRFEVSRFLRGLIEMTSGEILFNGQRIQNDLIGYKQRMGYVPEEPHLYAHLRDTTIKNHQRDVPEYHRAIQLARGLQFEELPEPALQVLGLNRDGVVRTSA